jgi:hypothetical protein
MWGVSIHGFRFFPGEIQIERAIRCIVPGDVENPSTMLCCLVRRITLKFSKTTRPSDYVCRKILPIEGINNSHADTLARSVFNTI